MQERQQSSKSMQLCSGLRTPGQAFPAASLGAGMSHAEYVLLASVPVDIGGIGFVLIGINEKNLCDFIIANMFSVNLNKLRDISSGTGLD